jgi:hypothetical protein
VVAGIVARLQPLTGSNAGYRRAVDQPLAAARLRTELLEWCLGRAGK